MCTRAVGRPTFNALSSSREDAHPNVDAIRGFIYAGGIAHGSELREEFWNIQEFWIWKNWKSVECYEHDDRRKFRNERIYSLKIPRTHRGRDPHCLLIKQYSERKQEYTCTRNPVLCMWKTLGPEDAVRRWKGQVSIFQMFPLFRELQWRADCIRVECFRRKHSFGNSPKNAKRLWRTTHQTWKFQWSNNLHVHVQKIDLDNKGNEDSCIINSRRIKMYASRFIDRQIGFPCFTNCEGIREFWKPRIQWSKSAGSRNIENEKWSKHYPPQWRVLLHRFSFQNCLCGESALCSRSSHKAVWKAARGRFWKGK